MPQSSAHSSSPPFIPAAYSARFSRFFGWYTRRLFNKRFAAVRLTPESGGVLEDAARRSGPLLIAMTHGSWWDPLIGLILAERFTPRRQPLAPMEHEQLAKFRFMTRLGIFGIDPDHPAALAHTTDYLLDRFRQTPETALWITPQGQFADPRAPIRLRPGLAALAARLEGPRVITIAIELAFWTEQRPEVFLRIASVTPATTNTPGWHRAITTSMQHNADELARLVIARDPAAFVTLPLSRNAGTGGVNPVYDLWLRLRGKDPKLNARRRD